MSQYKPYDSAGNKYGELRPAPQPTGVPFDTVAKALSSAEGSGIEADTKPSSTLEENIEAILNDLEWRDSKRKISQTEAKAALLSLYQKELEKVYEEVDYRLPSPSDNDIKEWRGHNLGLRQARIVLREAIDEHIHKLGAKK